MCCHLTVGRKTGERRCLDLQRIRTGETVPEVPQTEVWFWDLVSGRGQVQGPALQSRGKGSRQPEGRGQACVFVKVEEGAAWCEPMSTDPVWHRK